MNVLLLSAYDAASHRYWREGLVEAFPEYDWTIKALPPRHFNWRLRGNSLSWGFGSEIPMDDDYDLLVTTSMTDLSALKGFRPDLSRVPTIVYFHENQFAYPGSGQQNPSVEPQILNLYTALVADWLIFNSDYNRKTFMTGATDLLNKLPDQVPPGLIQSLSEKTSVIPVLLRTHRISGTRMPKSEETFTLVWNHRWEYDKAPERLMGALLKLKDARIDFKIHIVGQQFRNIPPIFNQMKQELGSIIGEWGFIEDTSQYHRILAESHVVISTALHDFQGLAIQEAVAAGCIPVVPNRLAYPEFFSETFRYHSFQSEPEKELSALADKLIVLARQHAEACLPDPPDLSHLGWKNFKPLYQSIMNLGSKK